MYSPNLRLETFGSYKYNTEGACEEALDQPLDPSKSLVLMAKVPLDLPVEPNASPRKERANNLVPRGPND
jgi:hypothetical protein